MGKAESRIILNFLLSGARWLETLFHQYRVRKRADWAFKVWNVIKVSVGTPRGGARRGAEIQVGIPRGGCWLASPWLQFRSLDPILDPQSWSPLSELSAPWLRNHSDEYFTLGVMLALACERTRQLSKFLQLTWHRNGAIRTLIYVPGEAGPKDPHPFWIEIQKRVKVYCNNKTHKEHSKIHN